AWISPRLRCSNAAPRQRYAKTSGARSRNEAANLRRAGGVLIRPHHGRAEFVRLGHQRRIGHDDPLSIEPHAVAALVGVPIDGRFANSQLKPWFDKLASGKGLCCSFADGFKVEDVDWDTNEGRYRVRLNGQWIVVPDAALVTEPNKFGPAVVW